MAKTKAPEENKPAFDVSQTDKRNNKRVILDYVVASKFAPDELHFFERFGGALDEIIAEVDATEGGRVHTAVDTAIEAQVAGIRKRYSEGGDYADYELREGGANFFVPKNKRAAKTVEEKVEDLLTSANDEQLAALAAQMRARGIEF